LGLERKRLACQRRNRDGYARVENGMMSLISILYLGIATLASAAMPQTRTSQTTPAQPQVVTAA